MRFQTLQNNYIVSEFGKAFISSKEQLNKKLNVNNNEGIKQKDNLSQSIELFKKIANADKKAISNSTKLLSRASSNNNNNYVIISNTLSSVYDGFNYDNEKYEKAWNSNVSVASIYSNQHLPKEFKNIKEFNTFPNSNIIFGKENPKPFFVKIERSIEENKEKRLFYRKNISYKYISFKGIDNLKCFSIPMEDLIKISKPTSFKCFSSTGFTM
ncbi:hypothetical protein BCR36DRAFT_587538 [Piromyces finnis]|uniref:Uncharacterized protein n=1 Tax=Piromyces finnis TaxID=1754191 RepID=A0A1Y1UVP1_9FUNG|nr:hypothetical protein BCR36DRAFT_587538 [Piromyces finnis]|eukprot:ORX42050.1 hypothetical protein BCR36DRAFT_587538 [Piromyces finnis]